MLPLEQALERILSMVRPLDDEPVPLASASGRIAAESITSSLDLPSFDNSAMDGYALRAEDVTGASRERPVVLHVAGQVAAGSVFPGELSPGQCARVFTGAPVPKGADSVLMQEDSEADPADPHRVRVLASVKPWENIRFRGEDVKQGDVLVQSGQRLGPGHVALLAATGCGLVRVGRRPVVSLLATGSELREAGQPLRPGQLYESNRACLAAAAASAGADPRVRPIAPDSLSATQAALAAAFVESDAVITCGGVSVGEMDFVKSAFTGLGGQMQFWRVAIKPGKPFVLGSWQHKLLFGLPGNPVSAWVTFLLLVRPALLKFQGANQTRLPMRPGILSEGLSNPGDRRHFVRVLLDEQGQVRSAGTQGSHLLHSLARANGLIDLPPESAFPAGTAVSVLVWD
jgi:molybdopterin molybdotransferase